MRLRAIALAAAAAWLGLVTVGGGTPPRPTALAVGYATPAALASALAAQPATVVRSLPELHAAEVRPAGDAAAFARALRRRPGIRYVDAVSARAVASEPGLLPGANGIATEWQYVAARETGVPASVQRAAASVTIAVVDTGADLTAPDIAAKSPITYSAVTGGTDVTDTDGHGTFVATIAAGSVTNGDGIAGFGGDAKLMIVQANRGGESFTDLDEASAIVWAVDHGARIVNLSIGGVSTSRTERSAIDYAVDHGALLVAAAGNEAGQGSPPEYPAALLQPVGSDGVGGRGLSVGASTASGARASFSNRGSYLSLVAPGVDVVGGVSSLSSPKDFPRLTLPGAFAGVYGIGSGTSYATPEVSGAAALVWAADPSLSAQGVAQILEQTASNRGAWNPDTGFGVLDVAAAVARASGAPQSSTLPDVRLRGRRLGRRVQLRWSGRGAAAYRLTVAEDGRPARTLQSGPATAASYALLSGHTYVFTVDAVDGSGASLASSSPYRVSLAPATLRVLSTKRVRR